MERRYAGQKLLIVGAGVGLAALMGLAMLKGFLTPRQVGMFVAGGMAAYVFSKLIGLMSGRQRLRLMLAVGVGSACWLWGVPEALASTGTGYDQVGLQLSSVYKAAGWDLFGAGFGVVMFSIIGHHMGSPLFSWTVGGLLSLACLFAWEQIGQWAGAARADELLPRVQDYLGWFK